MGSGEALPSQNPMLTHYDITVVIILLEQFEIYGV